MINFFPFMMYRPAGRFFMLVSLTFTPCRLYTAPSSATPLLIALIPVISSPSRRMAYASYIDPELEK